MPAPLAGFAIGGLQRFGAHRTRRREQKALAETHIVVEQIDHRAFVLDPLGDQIDAETAEQIGKVGRMNVGRGGTRTVEQQRRRHLDEAEAALVQFARIDAQIGEIVHGEAEAALGERGQALVLDRPHGADRALGELEHQRRRDRAVGLDEFEQVRQIRNR